MNVPTAAQGGKLTGPLAAMRRRKDGNMDEARWTRLYHALTSTLAEEVAGEVVELGCYKGQTACFLQSTLDDFASRKRLHVYDSFSGLPPLSRQDAGTAPFLKPGYLACQPEDVLRSFSRQGLRPPEIHAGWFHETLATELPDRIAFAHLDGDFYDSILVSLREVYPRLSPGAMVVVDDYSWAGTPGARRACDVFFADKSERVMPVWNTTQGWFRRSAKSIQVAWRRAA